MGLASQITSAPAKARGLFYGWWLVVISGFTMTIATVPLYHAMAVWSVALESHFGWSRGQLGLALTFTRIEGGLMGPIEGYMTDRLGARRMVLMGLLILGVGFLIFAGVRNLWMFYLAFIVMALGQGLGSWLPLMTTINNWFTRRRATAMGWANVGSRIGALLLVPAIAWAIDPEQTRLGWQMTALILGVFTLVIAFPLTRLIRNRPQDYGQLPDGDTPAPAPAPATQESSNAGGQGPGARPATATTAPRRPPVQDDGDMTAGQALRTPAFWLISFGHGFTSMVILAIMTHLGLLLKDKGFDVQTTGWIVVVYTATAMVFQLVGGYVGDRWPKNIALFIFTTIQAAAVVVLTLSSTLVMFYAYAVLFGIGFGGRNPLTTAIRGEYFGRTSFGRILGLSTVPMNVLLLIGSPMAGYMRDIQDSYDMAFLILAGFNFLGGVLFLFARKPRVGNRD
ncbi:MAG: MFS transporter [Chloroflexota bacterium]|nr:MFS transporter [Chloroflexota bacterium]